MKAQSCAICHTSFAERAKQWGEGYINVSCSFCQRIVCLDEQCHRYCNEGIFLCHRCDQWRIVTLLILAIECTVRLWAIHNGRWNWERRRLRLRRKDAYPLEHRVSWAKWYWRSITGGMY